jgi:hypothetical protein
LVFNDWLINKDALIEPGSKDPDIKNLFRGFHFKSSGGDVLNKDNELGKRSKTRKGVK